jgi:hypothetical protein
MGAGAGAGAGARARGGAGVRLFGMELGTERASQWRVASKPALKAAAAVVSLGSGVSLGPEVGRCSLTLSNPC